MNQILTNEELSEIATQEEFLLVCDGLDEFKEIARVIEQAILNKLNSAEPVRPDWYQNPTSEQWFESPDDAQILEDLDSITVGDVIELDVCWNGTQMFRVTKLADETSDDVEFELIESSEKLYLHPPAPSAVPDGLHIIDCGFKRCGTEATPTLLIGFAENDWDARDKFKAMLSAARSEE